LIYISGTRQKDGQKDPAVFESDKMMAGVLAEKTKKSVFMIPERGPNKKPDCVYDGDTMFSPTGKDGYVLKVLDKDGFAMKGQLFLDDDDLK
jgi:hypothetical protein